MTKKRKSFKDLGKILLHRNSMGDDDTLAEQFKILCNHLGLPNKVFINKAQFSKAAKL